LDDKSLLILLIISSVLQLAIWTNRDDIERASRLWNISLVQREVQSIGPTIQPVTLGNLETAAGETQNLYLKIRLSFRADGNIGHPNLFQTDDLNAGLRAELSRGTLALIIGDEKNSAKLGVMVLSSKLKLGNWYDLTIAALNGTMVSAQLTGETPQTLSGEIIDFRARNTRVGDGFDLQRRFAGEIHNAVIISGTANSAAFGRLVFGGAAFLAGLSSAAPLLMLLRRLWRRIDFTSRLAALRAGAEEVRRAAYQAASRKASDVKRSSDLLMIAGLLAFFAAAMDGLLWSYFQKMGLATRPLLLPGFEPLPEAKLFKSELVFFALLEAGFIGGIAFSWLAVVSRVRIPRFVCPQWLSGGLVLTALIAAVLAPHMDEKVLCMMAFGFFFAAAAVTIPAACRALFYLAPAWRLFVAVLETELAAALRFAMPASLINQSVPLAQLAGLVRRIPRSVGLGLLVGCTLVAAWPLAKAWYPVVLPNDYYEISDTYKPSTSRDAWALSRSDMVRCLTQSLSASGSVGQPDPSCPARQGEEAELSAITQLATTAGWQGAPGRILYHHSYMFVPATHFLSYGLDNAVPYLYGYGNTLFHAALMRITGVPTLTSYFTTYPFAVFFGLLAVGLVVGYAARDIWVGIIGFLFALTLAYSIDFSAALLAASFSPLRYVGLTVQLASIFCVFRGGPKRSFVIPLSMAFSLFWNTEFAVLGGVGQGLALLSPRLALSHIRRFSLLGISSAIATAFLLVHRVSPDIVTSVQLGFLNVGVPIMTMATAAVFFRALLSGQAILAWTAYRFPDAERDARLCVLAVIALVLVKYLYNPSPPHFSFTCILVAPMTLAYVAWPKASSKKTLPWPSRGGAAFLALVICGWAGQSYLESAGQFRHLLIDNFVSKSWAALGETMPMVTPEAPIASRVEAIRREIKPNDKVLILSPFDHILSFYVDPSAFCGHFEVLTNISVASDIESVVKCVQRSPNVLIVYDAEIEKPCDDLTNTALDMTTQCPVKLKIKQNMDVIMDQLRPLVTEVGLAGGLSFYRPRSARSANEPKPKIPAPVL